MSSHIFIVAILLSVVVVVSGCTHTTITGNATTKQQIDQIKSNPFIIKNIIEEHNLSIEGLQNVANILIRKEFTSNAIDILVKLGLNSNAAGLVAAYLWEFCISDQTPDKPYCILNNESAFSNIWGRYAVYHIPIE